MVGGKEQKGQRERRGSGTTPRGSGAPESKGSGVLSHTAAGGDSDSSDPMMLEKVECKTKSSSERGTAAHVLRSPRAAFIP